MIPREFYETGLTDIHASPINEGDEVVIEGFAKKKWLGVVEMYKGQFVVRYDDKTEDPLWEVHHVCEVVKKFNHSNFNDVLKRKIKQLELDLIKVVNESDSSTDELNVLKHFFTWDLEWLKERKKNGNKFTPTNSHFVWAENGNIKLEDI